jgi:hypothetical protein
MEGEAVKAVAAAKRARADITVWWEGLLPTNSYEF